MPGLGRNPRSCSRRWEKYASERRPPMMYAAPPTAHATGRSATPPVRASTPVAMRIADTATNAATPNASGTRTPAIPPKYVHIFPRHSWAIWVAVSPRFTTRRARATQAELRRETSIRCWLMLSMDGLDGRRSVMARPPEGRTAYPGSTEKSCLAVPPGATIGR